METVILISVILVCLTVLYIEDRKTRRIEKELDFKRQTIEMMSQAVKEVAEAAIKEVAEAIEYKEYLKSDKSQDDENTTKQN
ncbi:unnamed protein product [marine sediment metagenome]|uniref:Uncharacterized protein n=1 Tax=marine sediment metagenome TaxID=412755 RepID=X1GGQ8_9ZZZZ